MNTRPPTRPGRSRPVCRCHGLAWLSLALLFLSFVPARLGATSVIAPSFDQLVNQADYIVRARVKSVSSEWRTHGTHRYILTKVELDVSAVISGKPPQPLVLEMLGGKVGEDEMVVEGAPKFQVRDEDVLFIHGNGRQINPLVALMHGRYPIKNDAKTGRAYMTRSNGARLCSQEEVALPMETDQPAPWAERAALTPGDFTDRIKMTRRTPTPPAP